MSSLPSGQPASSPYIQRRIGVSVENHDEQLGVKLIANALTAPANYIAENAGFDGALAIKKIRKGE